MDWWTPAPSHNTNAVIIIYYLGTFNDDLNDHSKYEIINMNLCENEIFCVIKAVLCVIYNLNVPLQINS